MAQTVALSPTSQRNIISRLWNDKESRSVIIQIITISLVFAFMAYIIHNAVVNLQAIGKGFSYNFLWQPSSYDINQHLIDYNSRSSHFRAMMVGILNTILIAICGIVLASVVGFVLGVLRLSKNWIVNRLAYCYIEYVRNVPVLLHILLVHGLIVHAFPVPRQAISIGDVTFMTNRGIFSPKPLYEPLFLVVIALFLLGLGFMWWFKRYAKKVQDETGQRYPVFWIGLAAIVGLPLVSFFLLGSPITWDVPELKGFNFAGGMVVRPEFIALLLALSLYTSAFIGEIVRAGILGVYYGQTEASYALGINRGRTLSLVVIPQALRIIVPPLTSQYLNLMKNSSLAVAIGYMDIVATIGGISLNQTGREMECMIIVLTLYLVMSLIISMIMNWYNRRIKLVER
ncbi:MAG: ABC transporter permease subunit [Gammaproteobacteria bacterium]|nr:ABC transporter permease subunit [Gammaproteobacteria bacterium]MCY4219233.1 ABC transporter permease subunit [Gammaproteobacteria bacterium]MCY4274235.1 ABC transporter permease subunit [Gammaproteobacteria bacterium]